MILIINVCVFLLSFLIAFNNAAPPTKPINMTHGSIWPKPVIQSVHNSYLILNPATFKFKIEKFDCDILQDAMRRCHKAIFSNLKFNFENSNLGRSHVTNRRIRTYSGLLEEFHIYLNLPCEKYPYENMDEHYEIRVNMDGYEKSGVLIAQSIWGILHGLESISQMVVPIDGHQFAIHTTAIMDFPRFTHRGLLIDTSRHYLPLSTILKIIEAMPYSKLNVLHWHIVDDQSFPFQSATFPFLSGLGAYDANDAVYTHEDITQIVEFARLRGVRVYPEFDSPGHTLSWGKGIPNFLTSCYNVLRDGPYGPVDPTEEQNYKIILDLFTEVVNLFPERYFHIGGDEVDFGCWEDSDKIARFMRRHNMSGNYSMLEEYYINRVLEITKSLQATPVVWQEVFDNGVRLPRDTVVHVWTGDYYEELYQITKRGNKALLSACWYLDHLSTGGDWEKYYKCDPLHFNSTPHQKRLIIGGEACMWGEVVDESNVQQRIWPRTCAVAEVLWHGKSDINEAARRLEEHVCRLKRRGIPAQPPSGPGYCPYNVF